jgi:YfiH family protein
MLTYGPWDRLPGLRHGFLDAAECEAGPDWVRVLAAHDVRVPLARPKQVHGAAVLLAESATPATEGDAVVATRPGVAAGVITADCVPVLLRDRHGRALAAVHAGWRGAAAGVLEATLRTLVETAGVEPRDVEALIGPAAGACCYEVGDDVWQALRHRTAAAFVVRGDRHMLDLRAAVRELADVSGVAETHVLGPCTICSRDYASYRRDGAAAGRQLSFIALT